MLWGLFCFFILVMTIKAGGDDMESNPNRDEEYFMFEHFIDRDHKDDGDFYND